MIAHSRLDLARDCVHSLRRWLEPEDIVVVLNAPAGVDPADVKALSEEARIVSPPAPQGYSANLNLGAVSLGARHELLVLANDDAVFEADSVPLLADCVRADPRVGAAGARLVNPDGREALSFSRFPSVVDLLEASVPLPGPLWRKRQANARPWEAEPGSRGFPVGAALLVRRGAFDDVGGFDEDFFLNWEEADFAFRLHERGWTVTSCRQATVTHRQGSSIGRGLNFTSFYASERLYFRKRLGATRWAFVELVLVSLFGAGVVYDIAASLVRPKTAHKRLRAARVRWRTRVFLR